MHSFLFSPLRDIYDLGGPVVVGLIMVSIITLATVFYKLFQFRTAQVGQHTVLRDAVQAWTAGAGLRATALTETSQSYLAPVMRAAMDGDGSDAHRSRVEAGANTRFQTLEQGFRILDAVAQMAPLLGLFGTVLGMIEAFQALQSAGSQVDPSLLAGGIWVALLTTAVGLAVAMPTALVLSWFEGRMERERVFADDLIATILCPAAVSASTPQVTESRAYGT